MALEVFSQSWADAWAATLNASEAYRAAAAGWEGAVALVLADQEPDARRAVILDLWHGECRSARTARAGDLGEATYVFEGDRQAWREVLAEGGSPILTLMSGRIRLSRGTLAGLLPYAGAAKELLHLAGAVPSSFPEG